MSSNEWSIFKLGELAEITSSKRIFYSDYVESGIPFYRSKEIINKFNKQEIQTELFISEEKYNEIKEKFSVPQIGDLLLTSVGTLGVPYLVTDNNPFYFKDGNLTWFRKIQMDKIDPYYLFIWLSSKDGIQRLKEITIGSTQPALTIAGLKAIEIILPSIVTQKSIVEILSTLDVKIENNLATNQTLEEIARTLFKEWFVNFNYPNADGNLKHSEFGEIPESWEVGKFGDLADQIKSSVNPSQFPDKDFNHYSLPAFDTNELPNVDLGSSILSNKTGVKKYSVLFSKLNPRIPRIWSIGDIDESNSICSTEFIGFTPKQEFYYSYINYFLKQPELVTKLTGIAMGTSNSHQRIKPVDLLELEVLIPDEEVVKQYEKIVRPLLETRFHKIQENESLKITRDSLLPKLMSGEIEINS